MLDRLHKLAEQRATFAFETTLAARAYAPWIGELRRTGYRVHLHYFWLESADLAVSRVALRVQQGGHHIPEATIRLRYRRSARNFFNLYRPLLNGWHAYDNTRSGTTDLFAFGDANNETVLKATVWDQLRKEARS